MIIEGGAIVDVFVLRFAIVYTVANSPTKRFLDREMRITNASHD